MLGAPLRTHRQRQKQTLQDIAAACNLSYRVVWKLEHSTGSTKSLLLVLKHLNLEIAGRNLPPGEHLGLQLKALRLRQGLSLDAVSTMAGVSKTGIIALERTGSGHLTLLEKVADSLGAGLYLHPVGAKKSFYVHAGNSSGQDLWQTPKALMLSLVRVFGEFDLDPCAPRRRDYHTAKRGFTAEDDGLNRPWFGRVFINPPYSNLSYWVDKMVTEATSDKVSLLTALVPARTDTKWWHNAVQSGATVLFLKGRLKFGESDQSAPFPSALLFWKLPSCSVTPLRQAFPSAQLFVAAS